MAAVITTGNFPRAHVPEVKMWWGVGYGERPSQWGPMFEEVKSSAEYEDYVGATPFPAAAVKNQGANIALVGRQQGFSARGVNATVASGYAITLEEQKDNLYSKIIARHTPELATSFRKTKEILGALPYMNAFSATYPAADGIALCSTAHLRVLGGTYANKPTVDAPLAELTLEDACISVRNFTDDANLPIDVGIKCLIVSPSNEFNAARILKSVRQNNTANNAINAINTLNTIPDYHVNTYFTSLPRAWFLRTDVRGGMIYQNRQDLEVEASNDQLSKNMIVTAYERYVFIAVDPRGIFGVNAS